MTIPPKTEVCVSGSEVRVKGPLGELARSFRPEDVSIEVKEGVVTVSPKRETKVSKSLWGTYAAHVKNMMKGVNETFSKRLVVEGIGYRVQVSGKDLVLSVGYSHPVSLPIPEGLTVAVEKNEITISGSDKETVGEFTATVRASRKPEPYKGKGIRYEGEVVREKQGKKAITAAA